MKGSWILGLLLVTLFACKNTGDKTPVSAEAFSSEILLQVQNSKPYSKFLDSLQHASPQKLQKQLNTEAKKKAFWINLYNAFVQIKIKEEPTSYQNTAAFFESAHFIVCGTKLSLQEIQQVFLFGNKSPRNFGEIEPLMVKTFDPRILFALNCGSVSCPPIAFYQSDKIELQLDLAQSVFLKSDCIYDPFTDEVKVPELLKQIGTDETQDSIILSLLKKQRIVPLQAQPEIVFTPYDWSPQQPEFR